MEENQSKKIAAALSFDPKKDDAPVLKAAGKGHVAQKIIDIANENDIPLYEDKNTAQMLNALNIGETIPRELYEVIAQILVFIAKIDTKK